MKPRTIGIILGFGAMLVGILLLGTVIPSPKNWVVGEEGKVVDLRIETPVTWHPILGKWTMSDPMVETQRSSWIAVGAWFTNLLSFAQLVSDSQTVVVRLETVDGLLVKEERDPTGVGTPFAQERSVAVVLREIPPGEYILRVSIIDDSGDEITSRERPLRLVHIGGL